MEHKEMQAHLNAILNECEEGSSRYIAVQGALRLLESQERNLNISGIYSKLIITTTNILNLAVCCCGISTAVSCVGFFISRNPYDLLPILASGGTAYIFAWIAKYLDAYA